MINEAAEEICGNIANDYWDGENYYKNSSSQNEAAEHFFKHLSFSGSENILDIGCGDGKITAYLAAQVPSGSVMGIDTSRSMIDFAKEKFDFSNLDFSLDSAETMDFDNAFDWVVSFTALHWIKNHRQLVHNVNKSLRKGGYFALTMPIKIPEALLEVVYETIAKEFWKPLFQNFESGWNFSNEEDYRIYLDEENFSCKHCAVFFQNKIFPTAESFKGAMAQWLPWLRPLPAQLKDDFLNQILDKYLERNPPDSHGRLHFRVDRLEVVAAKKA